MKIKVWWAVVLQWCRERLANIGVSGVPLGFDPAADPEADVEGAYQFGPRISGY